MQEALARDRVDQTRRAGRPITKSAARREVKAFVQNVHHYRDDCLRDQSPPIDHVAIFDEAQRAWNLDQTSKFMEQKKGIPDFDCSEPEFLLSCVDRHQDWGVVICLVGDGQEINTGEAGIVEWLRALGRGFPNWRIYLADCLADLNFGARQEITQLVEHHDVYYDESLHLASSKRSFRAEYLSQFVAQMLELDFQESVSTLKIIAERYPIVLTRSLNVAKDWLRDQARGSERYGIVASSAASRLKPLGIDVRSKPDPVHWFLSGKDDVRSSYYLEDVATEFEIQGLELDWVGMIWGADFRYSPDGWSHHAFRGNHWQKIKNLQRKIYQKNAYRVLLTRARQGMVIVVPEGEQSDITRPPSFYDSTYVFLRSLGLKTLG